jgi:hypothetical protein
VRCLRRRAARGLATSAVSAGICREARPSNFLWVHVCAGSENRWKETSENPSTGRWSEVNSNCQSRFRNFQTTALSDGLGTGRRTGRDALSSSPPNNGSSKCCRTKRPAVVRLSRIRTASSNSSCSANQFSDFSGFSENRSKSARGGTEAAISRHRRTPLLRRRSGNRADSLCRAFRWCHGKDGPESSERGTCA